MAIQNKGSARVGFDGSLEGSDSEPLSKGLFTCYDNLLTANGVLTMREGWGTDLILTIAERKGQELPKGGV